MTEELKQIIRDLNAALKPHGLIITARQLMERKKPSSDHPEHTTQNPQNPHPAAHPNARPNHSDGHSEAGKSEREKQLAAKRKGLMAAMSRARGQGGINTNAGRIIQ